MQCNVVINYTSLPSHVAAAYLHPHISVVINWASVHSVVTQCARKNALLLCLSDHHRPATWQLQWQQDQPQTNHFSVTFRHFMLLGVLPWTVRTHVCRYL